MKLPEHYTPLEFANSSQLEEFLQLKIIINHSKYILDGREIEMLALSLKYLARLGITSENLLALENKSSPFSEMVSTLNNHRITGNSMNIYWLMSWSETVPSMATSGLFPIKIRHSELASAEQSRKFKKRRTGNTSKCSLNSWRRRQMRYYTFAPSEMGYLEMSAIAKRWNDQNLFYLTESYDSSSPSAGGIIVLWDKVEYELEAARHLSNVDTYELIADESSEVLPCQIIPAIVQSQMTCLIEARNDYIRQLMASGFLDKEDFAEFTSPKENEAKIFPFIYFRPMTDVPAHSATGTFQAKAVVETSVGPLHHLDVFLARLTSPIMEVMPGILNESIDLGKIRNKCGNGHEITSEYIGFVSARASSYGYQDDTDCWLSIDRAAALKAARKVYEANYRFIRDLAKSEWSHCPVDPETFENLLGFIFENSVFGYRHRRFYRQKKGLPLGSRSALFVANSFIYMITRHAIEKPPDWLITFQRINDECLFVCCFHPSHGMDSQNKLIDSFVSTKHGGMRFEVLVPFICPKGFRSLGARQCNFQDRTLSFDHVTCAYISKPNDKICFGRSFVHRSSKHPSEYFEDAIVAALTHFDDISSSELMFREAADKLFYQLCSTRGYRMAECSQALKIVNRQRRINK